MSGYTPTAADAAAARANAKRADNERDTMLRRAADSAAMLPYWDMSDALLDGLAGLRLGGETYLPRFADEDQATYDSRLRFTKFTNVYSDIIENLAAKPFEQETTLIEDDSKAVPNELAELCENIDGSGNNLTVFAGNMLFNAINSAIDWIFVDAPQRAKPNLTRQEAKELAFRPYWSHVLGRNVLEVRSKIIGADEVLTYIRVFEPGEPDHVRVCERLNTGVIIWTLYRKTDIWNEEKQTFFVEDSQGIFEIDEIPFVPFTTGRRNGRTFKFTPSMKAAAELAIDLYQQESGLKWIKTLAAYPMLAGNGVRPEKDAEGNAKKLAVGPGRVLYAPPDGAGNVGSWTYVEPSSQSLTFLAGDIKTTIDQLRELGRQPLTAQSGNLTVITTQVAANKARSALIAWAMLLKDALENAMVLTCKYMGIKPETYDPTVFVYTEFDEFIGGKDLETLDADRDRGDISRETLLEEKKRRGVYGPEFTIDRENERLLAEVPSDAPGSDNDPDDDPPPTE